MGTAEEPSLAARLVALVLRPVLIFFDLTLVGYGLLRWGEPTAGPADYFDWLAGLFPLGGVVADAVEPTLQLIVGGAVVAGVVGAAWGAALQGRTVGRFFTTISVPILALAGPGLALFLLHWFIGRIDVGLAPGWAPLADDPAQAVQRVILPATAIGLPLAPAVAALFTAEPGPEAPFGRVAAIAPLSSRSEPRSGWRLGIPAGGLLAGVMAAELVFGRPGLTTTLVDALARGAGSTALDVLALVALGGAGIALAVDLIGLRPIREATPGPAAQRLARLSAEPVPPAWGEP